MSGNFLHTRQNNSDNNHVHQMLGEQYEQTDGSSSEDKINFPFLTTPSGNLKVIPQQVVYESKQLSIVAADPRRTKVNIKSDSIRKDMSGGMEKKQFTVDQIPQSYNIKQNVQDNIREEGPSNVFRRMEMLSKMPPPPSRMFRQPPTLLMNGHPDGDSPSDDTDLFPDHGRQGVDRDSVPLDKKQVGGRTIAQFQNELSLAKVGAGKDAAIDWSKVDLPSKTDLHKLLHYRISNYIYKSEETLETCWCHQIYNNSVAHAARVQVQQEQHLVFREEHFRVVLANELSEAITKNPDVLVKIGNHEYRCHLLVLQCYSGFFVEKAMSRIELPEQSVTKQAFTYIYDWMLHLGGDSYTLLRRDNILEIFMAAQYLQVKELEEQCWAFIDNEDLFSEDKAFLLYLDARCMGNTAVMELMVPRIQRFFLTLVSSKDFLELVVEEVSVFLRSNYICIHCEMEVFMAAVRWLMCDWEKRHKHLVEVMSCVRFGLISPWQLVDVRRNPENQEFLLVTRNPDVSCMIEDGLAFAIISYWYGNDSSEYNHWIETLGLAEPTQRNWAGTKKVSEQQKYTTYQEFLTDLADYRRVHIATKKGTGDSASSECLQAEVDRRGLPNTEDFILPHPRL